MLVGALPPADQLQALINAKLPGKLPPQNHSSVAQHQEQIVKLYKQGVEIAAIWARLQEQGYTGGYHAIYRLVRKLAPQQPEVFVRVERKPGEEAQVDFGYVGYLLDPASWWCSYVCNANWFHKHAHQNSPMTVILGLLLSGVINIVIAGPAILLGLFDQLLLALISLVHNGGNKSTIVILSFQCPAAA